MTGFWGSWLRGVSHGQEDSGGGGEARGQSLPGGSRKGSPCPWLMDPRQLLHDLDQVVCSGLSLHSAAIVILQQEKQGRCEGQEGALPPLGKGTPRQGGSPHLSLGYGSARIRAAAWRTLLSSRMVPRGTTPVSSTQTQALWKLLFPVGFWPCLPPVGLPEFPDMPQSAPVVQVQGSRGSSR